MARRGVLPPACLTQNGRQGKAGRDGAEKRLPVSAQTIPRSPAPTPYFELLLLTSNCCEIAPVPVRIARLAGKNSLPDQKNYDVDLHVKR